MINQQDIQKAASILKQGGVVAFPTETVYGLGADATNPKAIARLFAVKKRPLTRPLSVLLADAEQLNDWARELPQAASLLAKHFWPGPLTLVVPHAKQVSEMITCGQATIGLRVPNHPIALQLLQTFGSGIAAPSANYSGHPSPTSAEEVRKDLGNEIDLILDGGECALGIPSTVVDCSSDPVRILRVGAISVSQIEQVIA